MTTSIPHSAATATGPARPRRGLRLGVVAAVAVLAAAGALYAAAEPDQPARPGVSQPAAMPRAASVVSGVAVPADVLERRAASGPAVERPPSADRAEHWLESRPAGFQPRACIHPTLSADAAERCATSPNTGS